MDVLREPGVIGLASTLVKTESKYEGVVAYLLGRVVVAESIDDAVRLAKKNHYTLNIVTLEGELLRPGGSLTGGAFRNSSNLLARKREMEELESSVKQLEQFVKEKRNRLEEIKTAQSLLSDDMEENRSQIQEQYILQNTAKMNVDRMIEQKQESDNTYTGLQAENQELDLQLAEIAENKAKILAETEYAAKREQQIGEENENWQKLLDEKSIKERELSGKVSETVLELAGYPTEGRICCTEQRTYCQ